jgi:excinuclease UvrABC helicase subunit UvrB
MEAVTMFPNSVNAPSETVIKDKLHRIERLDQISRQLNETVQATTRYSAMVYYYSNGEIMESVVRIRSQMLDVFA